MKRQFLIYLNFSVFLWCCLILTAPILRYLGFTAGSDSLYYFFSYICHQHPERSFFIFGEKFAVCIRCTSIYVSFFIFSLLYYLLQTHNKDISISRFVFLAMLAPMAIDVALDTFGIHSSSSLTRLVTGTLAGAIGPFYILPALVEAVEQLYRRNIRNGVYAHDGKTD